MNLAIDIGNTRVKIGRFLEGNCIETDAFDSLHASEKLSTIMKTHPIDSIGVSSVHQNHDWLKPFEAHITWINHTSPLPITLDYDTPETLGVDRICNAVGATVHYPNQHVLAIDAGTCITYDLLSSDQKYLGGAISPGLEMRLQAMHQFTQRLPKAEISENFSEIGKSTITSLQMGAGLGAAKEMDGMINHFRAQHANLKVILTGGDHPFFERHVENPIFAAPNLVLEGIDKILRHKGS